MDPSGLVPDLTRLPILPHVRDLAIAYILAFIIGWNREAEERSAGIRTFPLVAVAACGIVQASEPLLQQHPEGVARVIEGIITGIGFIGAGAIIKGTQEVHGTATAAALWATAIMGTAVGLGAYHVAGILCLFTAVTLYVVTRLKKRNRK